MSIRTNALAVRLEQGAHALAGVASALRDAEWQARVPRDGRKIGVVVHHVATMYPLEIQLAQLLADGKPVTDVTWEIVHELNARHAKEHDAVTKETALALLGKHGTAAAAAIRALSDEQLDRAAPVSLNADAPLTCQFVLEDHAVRHSYHHLAKIKGALKRITAGSGVAVGALLFAGMTAAACSDGTLSAPPPTPATVAVAYCTGLEPDWVAFQDGDGEWTRAQPTVSGSTTTFRHDFSDDHGAIAAARPAADLTVLSVLYGTPAQLATAGDTNAYDCGPFLSKTLFGTAAGLDVDDVGFVDASFGSRVRIDVEHRFALKGLPDGPRDLLATRTTQTDGSVTRVILRRDIDAPDSTTLPVFDFASPEAFAPAVANVTLNGLGADDASSGTRLRTTHDEISVTLQTNTMAAVTRPYVALSETRLAAGDLQILSAGTSAGASGSARSATLYFRAPTDHTLTFGALLVPPTFTTVATAPALRLRAHFVPQADYDRSTVISYQQGLTTFVTVAMTAAYAALTATGYDLVVPDLSGATGFDPAWALHSGGTLRWNAGRVGGTLGLGRDAVPSDGTTRLSVSAAGELDAGTP